MRPMSGTEMVSLLESSDLELSGSPEELILDLDSGADATESEYASDCRNVTNT